MKRLIGAFFVLSMILSVAFVGDNFSAQAQTRTGQVTVKKKRTGGIVGGTVRGAKWVGRKTWNGTKWVGRKSYQGARYAGGKTVQGTKYVGKKTWKGTKKVGSVTKKVLVGN